MRGYKCYYHHQNENGKLIENTNNSCWAGIGGFVKGESNIYRMEKLNEENKKFIFVGEFEEEETKKYIPLLIRILNKITPCCLVQIEDKQYIKIKLLHSYDSSLIVLNFLRNLWCDPGLANGYGDKIEYTEAFFNKLKTSRKYHDAMERLTYANKLACEKSKLPSVGHSNAHPHTMLVVRKTAELHNYTNTNTINFLTGGAKDTRWYA